MLITALTVAVHLAAGRRKAGGAHTAWSRHLQSSFGLRKPVFGTARARFPKMCGAPDA